MSHSESHEPLYRRAGRGCGGIFFAGLLVLAAAWGAGLGLFVNLLEDAQARMEVIEGFRPKIGSKFYDKDGELLGEFTTNYRQLVALRQIPLHVQKAFLATEDDRFYEHKGVRPDAMVKGLVRTLRSGDPHGGSTITQQIVRNLEGKLVGRERTIERKLREMLFALQLEREYTKDEIFELYLNQIFLGGSAYGIEAAARQYFGKHVEDLTLSEAATLAGLTRGPNINRPDRYPENALARRDIVLGQMLEDGFISPAEHDAALQDPIKVISGEERLAQMAEGKGFWGPNQFLAPYFVEEVRKEITRLGVTKQELLEGGLEIYTTLDLDLQLAAEDILKTALSDFDAKKRDYLERRGRLDEFTPVTGALICMDNREGHEGAIRALVGGRDWERSKFNNATQAKRQPGSSVKPYVWAAAIAQGMTPSTVIVDEPFVRIDPWGNRWEPKNFGNDFEGPITLRRALEKSRNIVSVKLVERLGFAAVKGFMQSAGVRESDIPNYVNLTLALGTPVVTPMEQCTAYATFAKNGVYSPPFYVNEVRNPDGFLTYEGAPETEPNALPPNVAYVVTHMMEGVARWGTGARTAPLGDRPRAGKTGTTNENRDVWFCGFTRDYTCVVWMGYRDNRSLGQGSNYTGGRLACPVWTDFMLVAHEDLPMRDFEVPEGVTFYSVDRHSGLAGGGFREAFLTGTEPPVSRPVLPDAQMLEELMSDELLVDLDPGASPEDAPAVSVEPLPEPSPLADL